MKLYYTNQTIDRHIAREVELLIEKETGIELDNPFYDGDAKEVADLDTKGTSNMTPDEIVGRDLKRIREADGILAYMSADRNIGSCMEIALCANWGKVVYIIATKDHIATHPWIKYYACRIFRSPEDFITWVKTKRVKSKGMTW